MKPMSLNQLKQIASDMFSYILLGCPNFPKGTRTTTKTAFEELIGLIDAIIQRTKSEEARQWLGICLQEIQKSYESYEDGNISDGKKLIQQAEEHFNNGVSKKPIESRFIADEKGASRDTKGGFPD